MKVTKDLVLYSYDFSASWRTVSSIAYALYKLHCDSGDSSSSNQPLEDFPVFSHRAGTNVNHVISWHSTSILFIMKKVLISMFMGGGMYIGVKVPSNCSFFDV